MLINMRSFGLAANFLCPPLAAMFKERLSKPPASYLFLTVFCFCEAVLIAFDTTLHSFDTIFTSILLAGCLALAIAVAALTLKVSVRVNEYFIGLVIACAVLFAYHSVSLQDYIRVHLISCFAFLLIYAFCLFKDCSTKTLDIVSLVCVIVDIVGLYLSVLYMFAP
jgi:hypothetical protein